MIVAIVVMIVIVTKYYEIKKPKRIYLLKTLILRLIIRCKIRQEVLYMDNQIKGALYEQYICKNLNDEGHSWLWSDIPEKDLVESGLVHDLNKHRLKRKKHLNNPDKYVNPLIDTGIDILLYNNEEYTLVQCKNGYDKGLTFKDLSGFNMMMVNHETKKGRVYYTSKLSKNIKENNISKRIKYIKKTMDEDDEEDIVTDKAKHYEYKLYDFQKIALKQLSTYFEKYNRGILSSPCGTGKTIMGCFFAHTYNSVILLSPLKQYAEQNSDRYNEYFKDYHCLIIDSDGTRDIDVIKKFIKKNRFKKMLFSCTFKSVDIVNKFIHKLENNIVIIDEFHNLSRNNIIDKDDEMNKLLLSDNDILFQSATPRVYDLEGTDDDNEHSDIFGDVVYKMDFKTAIEKEYICDYKIYLPSVSENKKEFIKQIKKEIDISMFDKDMRAKCMYFYKCMLFNGTRKCIVYLRDIEEMCEFKKCLKTFDEYYATNLSIYTISSDDKHSSDTDDPEKNSREWKLRKFKNSKKMTAMLSVKILDECVDIQECDSVFITYSTKAKRRTIQRICRCIRKDKNNKHKIGHVYLWCNEYEEILETLSGLKEYDNMFKDKIKLIDSEYGIANKNNVECMKQDEKSIDNYLINVIEYKRRTTWDESCKLLFEFCDEHKRCPKQKEESWLRHQKEKINDKKCELYKKLSQNEYVKELLDKYLEYKKNNKNKIRLSWEESCKLLFEFCNKHKRCPTNKEHYWLNTQKEKINDDKCKLYKKLSQNEYVKESLDKYLEYKKNNINNKILSWEESCEKLFEFCNKNKRCPKLRETLWLNTQKGKINDNKCEMYKKLSQNKYVKDSLDEYLKNKEKNCDKKILNWDESCKILFEFCNEYKRCPKNKENLWLQCQKGKINDDKCEIYKKMSQNKYVKDSLDEYLNPNKKWNESCEKINEFYNKHKRLPTRKENSWFSRQKQNMNDKKSDLYKKLSQNENIKEILDTYLEYYNKNIEKFRLRFDVSCEKLFEFCDENKRCPTLEENSWFKLQKGKINDNKSDLYKKLSQNKYVKESLDKYLEKKTKVK